MQCVKRGSDKMRNIIFIAPPAAGKGTVSDYLVKNFNYEHISTGEILREEIKSGSLLGKELDSIISQGKLVSDQYMIKLISDKLKSIKDKAFIGCNSVLLAPVNVGENSIIAASSTIDENVPANSMAISRKRQVTKIDYLRK